MEYFRHRPFHRRLDGVVDRIGASIPLLTFLAMGLAAYVRVLLPQLDDPWRQRGQVAMGFVLAAMLAAGCVVVVTRIRARQDARARG